MRRFSIVAATFGVALLSTSISSFAADQYTYRAGQAYLKSAAGNHTECEAQCRGDAACRGWNFVRPNPRSRTGICEFNARKAVPVSSPISISGEISTSVDPLMSHAVPQIGRMTGNTVRVGTPIMPNREIPKRRIAKRQMAATPSAANQARQNPKRIVRRLPIPATGQNPAQSPVQAAYKRTLPAQNSDVRTPRVYGSLVAPTTKPNLPHQMPQIQAPQRQAPQQQAARPQMTPMQAYRQQMLDVQRRGVEQMRQRQQQQVQQQAMRSPRMPQNFAPQGQMPSRGQNRAPQQFAPRPIPQQMGPQQMGPQQMMRQPNSLYGSLHDDLTIGMTPVPRPQTAPDSAANPDTPLATSRAVPTKPVNTEALQMPAKKPAKRTGGYPAIPGLAGG